MTDIVERLRVHAWRSDGWTRQDAAEAADEIERMRADRALERSIFNTALRRAQTAEAESDRLREALRDLADIDGSPANVANAEVLASRVRSRARAALKEDRND